MPYADQIRQLNRSDEINKVILYPGVEYITSTWTSSGWAHSAFDSTKFVYNGHRKGARLYPNYMEYGNFDYHVDYEREVEQIGRTVRLEDQPFPIQRW